ERAVLAQYGQEFVAAARHVRSGQYLELGAEFAVRQGRAGRRHGLVRLGAARSSAPETVALMSWKSLPSRRMLAASDSNRCGSSRHSAVALARRTSLNSALSF